MTHWKKINDEVRQKNKELENELQKQKDMIDVL